MNLAGNGNLEYNATSGWAKTGGALALETGAGLVHGGTYSIADTGRTANYMGPSYAAARPGRGSTTSRLGHAEHRPDLRVGGVACQLNCGAANTANYCRSGTTASRSPKGVWTKITGTIDLAATARMRPVARPAGWWTP